MVTSEVRDWDSGGNSKGNNFISVYFQNVWIFYDKSVFNINCVIF